nr:tigger transposable element-derived protein 1-like [Procambarus clarkii]
MKDRLTLVLCANASGDCKVKPLLVYHSENPRVFKACKVYKARLNVICEMNCIPKITIKFLPPNTTPLLQPMDQKVIANFKKLYMKALLERCVDVTDNTGLTLKEFWKNHFNILGALRLIDKAWEGVTRRTLNSAWRNLWPEGVPERDFEGFGPAPASASAPVEDAEVHLVDDIVALGQTLGLELDAADVQELVVEQSEELTIEELLELQKEINQEEAQEFSSGEEVVRENAAASSSEIREVLGMFEKVTALIEKHHPDQAVTTRWKQSEGEGTMSSEEAESTAAPSTTSQHLHCDVSPTEEEPPTPPARLVITGHKAPTKVEASGNT